MNYRYRDKSELKQVESDWFALVPDNWNVLMFKRIVESVKNGIWGDEPKQNEDDIPCIRILNFNRNEMEVNIDDLTTRNIPILKQRDYLLKKGDLLIEKSGGGEKNPVGFVARYNHDLPAVYANFMAKISLKENEAKSEYIKYLCSNIYNKRIHLDSVNQTTGIQNLDTETYFKRFIPLPNINEQEKIAKFLDEKTAQFDSIISKKEALIEKLEEAKKSLISEVVTGKVKVVKTNDGYELVERKKEEMKDSGVEWLGDIPKEWIRKKLKYNCYIKGRIGWQGLKQSEFIDEGPYLITGMNFKNGVINWSEVYHISEERYQEAPEIHLKLGDVLITKDGTIGKLLFIDYLPGKASLNSHLLVMRPLNNDFLPKFLYYSLDASYFKEYVEQVKTGTTFFGITQESISNFNLLIPSLDEQKIVIEYLDERLKILNEIIYKVKYEITKIKEAKKSLISEAVTGKIEILD